MSHHDPRALDTLLTELVEGAPLSLLHAPARGGAPHVCDGGTHSRLPDGRQLCWAPVLEGLPLREHGLRLAIDAEPADAAVPPAVARDLRRRGADAAFVVDPGAVWTRWTRAEVRAKLAAEPILAWAQRYAWHEDDAGALVRVPHALRTCRHDLGGALVVTWGIAPVQTSGPGIDDRMETWGHPPDTSRHRRGCAARVSTAPPRAEGHPAH